jgi:hypothetical protein
MAHLTPRPTLYGLMAEFDDPTSLVAAANAARLGGYRRIDAFSPIPIEELHGAIGFHHTKLPLIVLVGGIVGGLAGYYLQYWASAIAYPMNIGGRPFNSWPQFVPITFEMTILGAALAAVFGMLALNGLPMPYHPVFNTPRFALASRNRFFLLIESRDAKFDREATQTFLESLDPRGVSEVAW